MEVAMVDLMSLWLPILVASVLVFIVSSVLHVALPLHKSDNARLAGEAGVLEAMRKEGVTPGDYAFPYCTSMKDMGTDEMKKKLDAGPVGFMTVYPNGPINMGKALVLWFLYTVVVGLFVAYVASLTLAAGEEYMRVFRITSVTAFIAYALGAPVASIWKGQKWSTSFKFVLDGFLYSLATAGAFGWLWPS
jgi:hypothetical protein